MAQQQDPNQDPNARYRWRPPTASEMMPEVGWPGPVHATLDESRSANPGADNNAGSMPASNTPPDHAADYWEPVPADTPKPTRRWPYRRKNMSARAEAHSEGRSGLGVLSLLIGLLIGALVVASIIPYGGNGNFWERIGFSSAGSQQQPSTIGPRTADDPIPGEETPERPDYGGDTTIGESFNPQVFYSQSCDPQQNADGGCSWDIGTMGDHWNEALQRNVVQVGIVKGADISWNGNSDSDHERCELVVLTPNSWFENLTVKDANVTIYDVWEGDIGGWTKTLAVQNAQEQSANYGCENWHYRDIQKWGSNIPSPPCGVDGFRNCTDADFQDSNSSSSSNDDSAQPASDDSDVAEVDNGFDTSNEDCPTVNCKERKQTSDYGGKLSFGENAAVYGYKIVINGKTYTNCYFEDVPDKGTVTDGVVNYWPAEVKHARAC